MYLPATFKPSNYKVILFSTEPTAKKQKEKQNEQNHLARKESLLPIFVVDKLNQMHPQNNVIHASVAVGQIISNRIAILHALGEIDQFLLVHQEIHLFAGHQFPLLNCGNLNFGQLKNPFLVTTISRKYNNCANG